MRFLRCITISYYLAWFSTIKVSNKKSQCNVENAFRNRMCKRALISDDTDWPFLHCSHTTNRHAQTQTHTATETKTHTHNNNIYSHNNNNNKDTHSHTLYLFLLSHTTNRHTHTHAYTYTHIHTRTHNYNKNIYCSTTTLRINRRS